LCPQKIAFPNLLALILKLFYVIPGPVFSEGEERGACLPKPDSNTEQKKLLLLFDKKKGGNMLGEEKKNDPLPFPV